MPIYGDCPTPRKPTYRDKSLADSIVIRVNHKFESQMEVYDCGDHWHIRDKAKRRKLDRARYKEKKKLRKVYQQLTIFDWMNELDGT